MKELEVPLSFPRRGGEVHLIMARDLANPRLVGEALEPSRRRRWQQHPCRAEPSARVLVDEGAETSFCPCGADIVAAPHAPRQRQVTAIRPVARPCQHTRVSCPWRLAGTRVSWCPGGSGRGIRSDGPWAGPGNDAGRVSSPPALATAARRPATGPVPGSGGPGRPRLLTRGHPARPSHLGPGVPQAWFSGRARRARGRCGRPPVGWLGRAAAIASGSGPAAAGRLRWAVPGGRRPPAPRPGSLARHASRSTSDLADPRLVGEALEPLRRPVRDCLHEHAGGRARRGT